LKSPLTRNEEPKIEDLDLFFYVLEAGVEDKDVVQVIANSLNFTVSMGISEQEAKTAASIIIGTAFSALSMIPHPTNVAVHNSHEDSFDADWITRHCLFSS
jgi:hypothetical protein